MACGSRRTEELASVRRGCPCRENRVIGTSRLAATVALAARSSINPLVLGTPTPPRGKDRQSSSLQLELALGWSAIWRAG